MFAAPPDLSLEWRDDGVEGASRFLKRLWRAVQAHVEAGTTPVLDKRALSDEQKALRRKLHETIAKVGDDYGRRKTFRSEERRGGKECVSTCRSRWSPDH